MGFTDDWYTDGRVPSVRPSVIIVPMDFIACTDGISLSVKLVNGLVMKLPGIQSISRDLNLFNLKFKWHLDDFMEPR